ncbi:MAG TPA: hypothetical protein VF037_02150, partial [Gemmatimonadales bacterium]
MGLVPAATNDLFDDEGLAGRDIGIALIARAGRRVLLEAGIYNGEGESAPRDVNDAKTIAGRLGVTPAGRLTIGVSAISHEGLPDSLGPTVRHAGWGVDLGWSEPGQPGLFALAELMSAESFEASPRRIRGGLLVAAWNIPVERRAIHSVEPVARLDMADPDDAAADDETTLLSAGVGLYFTPTAQFRLLAERQGFADGREPVAGIRSALTVSF